MEQISKRLGWLLPMLLVGCGPSAERSQQALQHEDSAMADTGPGMDGEQPNGEDPGEMEGEEPTDAGAPSEDTAGPSKDAGSAMDTGVMDARDAAPRPEDGLYLDFVLHFAGPASDPRPNNCIFIRTTTGRTIDVGGYVVRSESNSFTMPAGTSVPASDALVVHWNSAGTNDADDVWTGPGVGNLSTLEDEVMVMRPASATNRVVAYVRWDTDGTFGNAPTDPYGTTGVSLPTTAIARAAGAWDTSYVNVAGVDFTRQALQLRERVGAPGTTASDWFIVTK